MTHSQPPSPVNPMPPVVVALFLVVLGIEAAFNLGTRGLLGGPGAVGWRQAAIQTYAFNSEVMSWMIANGIYPPEHLIRFVSYVFVHGSFTHALFAGVMLLALGKFVGEVMRQWAVLTLFFGSALLGAAFFGLTAPGRPWLVGSFPGVYGLIGGFTYLMWLKLGQMGARQFRAFTLIGVLMLLQLVFGLLFGGIPIWRADVAGFAAGFMLSVVLVPGGWQKIRAKLRHR